MSNHIPDFIQIKFVLMNENDFESSEWLSGDGVQALKTSFRFEVFEVIVSSRWFLMSGEICVESYFWIICKNMRKERKLEK